MENQHQLHFHLTVGKKGHRRSLRTSPFVSKKLRQESDPDLGKKTIQFPVHKPLGNISPARTI